MSMKKYITFQESSCTHANWIETYLFAVSSTQAPKTKSIHKGARALTKILYIWYIYIDIILYTCMRSIKKSTYNPSFSIPKKQTKKLTKCHQPDIKLKLPLHCREKWSLASREGGKAHYKNWLQNHMSCWRKFSWKIKGVSNRVPVYCSSAAPTKGSYIRNINHLYHVTQPSFSIFTNSNTINSYPLNLKYKKTTTGMP